jgi:prepilin-type N-terminal cleavage/methylation domain-containing protein
MVLPRNKQRRLKAFTLLELLVVSAIISVLTALLIPGLSLGQRQSQRVRCLANLHQIGVALLAYATENNDSFPVNTNWGNVGGTKGSSNYYDDPGFSGFPGDRGIAGVRKLNKFLTSRQTFQCPADAGDTLVASTLNCYDFYGTSYLFHWQGNVFGVMHVTANANPTWGYSYPGIRVPMKIGKSGNMSIKIIAGDWNWHANRPISAPRTMWHVKGNQRQQNMLFGDSHAEFFTFPAIYDQSPINANIDWDPVYNPNAAKPDPANGFW